MLDRLFKRKTIGADTPQSGPAETVRQLIADGKLSEARRLGEEAVTADPADEESLQALVEVYLALEAQCIDTQILSFLPEITQRINELLPQLASSRSQLRERHNEIVRKSLPGYRQLMELEILSGQPGHENESYEAARKFIAENNPDARLLTIYATIISRLLRLRATENDSMPARQLLAEYLSLPIARPSRVHSLILRQAIRMARIYPDFKFGRFLEMWDTATFRPSDIVDPEGKVPLAVSAFETLLESDDVDRLPALLSRLPVNDDERLSVLRDAFAHMINKSAKGGDQERATELLMLYSRHATLHKPCRQHSIILELAIKAMTDNREWCFPEFFINWSSENFTQADFAPITKNSGDAIPSLAIRALRKCFHIVQSDVARYSYLLNRFLDTVDNMIRLCPGRPDEFMRRRRAGIVSMLDRPDLALDSYAEMAREQGHGIEFWTEYADLVDNHHTKASLFAFAIVNGELNDKDIARAKLYLARELHFNGHDDDAANLLDDYREHCADIAAEPLPVYGAIRNIIPPGTTPRLVNDMLYHTLAAEALDFIYRDVPSRLFSVVKCYSDNTLLVTDSTEQLNIDTATWPLISRLGPGDNIEIKCIGKDVIMARPAQGEPYRALKRRYAIVLPDGKVVCGALPEPIDCKNADTASRYVSVSIYRDAESRWHALAPKKAYVADVRREFEHVCGTLYAVDDDYGYFTAGPGGMCGRVARELCDEIPIGVPADFYFYIIDDDDPVVFSITEAIDPQECVALLETSGPLTVRPDGSGDVKGIFVPADMISADMIGSYVKVNAVFHPAEISDSLETAERWHALSVSLYN